MAQCRPATGPWPAKSPDKNFPREPGEERQRKAKVEAIQNTASLQFPRLMIGSNASDIPARNRADNSLIHFICQCEKGLTSARELEFFGFITRRFFEQQRRKK
jgi:hypothetical protein